MRFVTHIERIFIVYAALLLAFVSPGWSQAEAGSDHEGQVYDEELDAPTEGDIDNGLDPPAGVADFEEFSPDYAGVEEIMVTSSGRAQPLQDVSVSVAAFDAEYMYALGASNISDIAQFTPNLEIRSVFSASNPTIFIRGVGLRDFNANSSSSVAVYNDDVYMNSPAGQLAQLYDVQGVEILRGPQGTLYGRNASAGAIVVRARKPTGTIGGYTRVTYGRFNQMQVEGAVETPIFKDTLSIRIAGTLSKREGTTLNRCGSRSAWGAGANGNPPVAFGGDPRDINKAIANSFQSIVYKNCFNQGTVLPRSVGGQDWYSGGTVPDVNFGLYNVPGANNFSLNLPGVSQSDCNELGPGGCNFTGSAEQARLPNVARRVNNRDTWATRAILRWQPTTEMDWQLNVHGGRASPLSRQFQMIPRTSSITSPELVNIPTDNQGYADPDNITGCLDPGSNTISQGYKPSNGFCQFPVYGTNPEDGDPFAGDYNRTGRELLDLAGTSLTGEIYADNWRYRTISAFEWNQRSVDANLDGTPNIGIELGLGNEAWQLSEEVRAFWDGGGDFTAQLGGFFLYESLDVNNTFRLNEPSYQAEVPLPGNPPSTQAEPTVTLQRYSMQTYSASAYGSMSWEPSEYTTIEGGLRYNFDYKSMDLTTTLANFFTGGPLTGIDIEQRGSTSVDASGLSGDISINYKPVQDVNAYWKYSRGFKGPHINGGAIGTTKAITLDDLISPVGPESVNAIEVGLKTLLFDGRLRWNTALYYYDYTDIQIFQLKNAAGGVPVQQLVNAQDADIYGLETEVDVRPLEGWAPEDLEDLQLFASFGFNKSAYTNFVNVRINYDSQGRPIPLTIDNSGNTLINAPEISFAGFAQWKFPVGNYGFLTPRFDWTYKSSVFFSPENLDDISQGAFWLFNLRLGFTIPDARIEVAAFVMNVANEVYRLDAINLSTFRGITLYAMGDPRTYGVAVSIEF